jgi:NAD(P)-dependent dehydrogenase (short-subunit alcohol dehydrogenase family)
MDFRDKRVVVTAAGRGIARRAAERYLEAGARVVAADVDEGGLAGLKKVFPQVATIRVDVGVEKDVDALFHAVEKGLGGLDILINAAGIAGQIGAVEDITAEGWRRCFAVNVDGAFYCARRAIPLLKAAGRGSIVNFSSMAGIYPYLHRSPYVAAKFAIIGLTKTLAMEPARSRASVWRRYCAVNPRPVVHRSRHCARTIRNTHPCARGSRRMTWSIW